ncbi:hypothetical protein [Lentzea sp. NPDC004782]|uniref:Rv1733c family protein n=1 Tax=Lentzea sp. NPDC004782 TaxID=3154458 RepID=UPI0033AFFE85
MSAKPMSRLVRRVFPCRNKLAGTGDRIEGAVLAVAVAVSLLAVPVTATIGSELYTSKRDQVADQQASRHEVDAVLVEDAPTGEQNDVLQTVPVKARWKLPDGATRQGEVPTHHDLKAGTTVRVWIDASGTPTDPPLTTAGVAVHAAVIAFLVWTAIVEAMVLLYLAVKFTHTRIRARRWAAEWARVAPEWTGR